MNMIWRLLGVLLFVFIVLPINISQSIAIFFLGLRGYRFDDKTRTFTKGK